MVLSVGGEAFPMAMRRLGDTDAGTNLHWVARGDAGVTLARAMGEALAAEAHRPELRIPGWAAPERLPAAGSAGVLDGVVRRCSPAFGHAEALAAGNGDPRVVVGLWLGANNKCRGSSDEAVSGPACDEREAYGRRPDGMGWCYARRAEPASQARWHRCGPTSIGRP